MAKNIPFDEDTMTLIMGLGGPEKPGQHGRTMIPAPKQQAIDLITEIRDMCEEYLRSAEKGDEEADTETDTEMPEDSEE